MGITSKRYLDSDICPEISNWDINTKDIIFKT